MEVPKVQSRHSRPQKRGLTIRPHNGKARPGELRPTCAASGRTDCGIVLVRRRITFMRKIRFFLLAMVMAWGNLTLAQSPAGIFEDPADVGTVLHPGSSTFDAAKSSYTLRGSGENMWATQDAFQFAWKKVSGDVELTADIQFRNTAGNEHKKAVLIFRQSLDADSVYVDVALHGNGLTALQYRLEKGATTQEVQSSFEPRRDFSPTMDFSPVVQSSIALLA